MTYLAPKSEQEYKEYLDNLLVEYQFACFGEKLGDGTSTENVNVSFVDLFFLSP